MAAAVVACALASVPARGGQLLEHAKPVPVSTMAEMARSIRAPFSLVAPFIELLEPGFTFSTFERDCAGGMDFLPDGDLLCLNAPLNSAAHLYRFDANQDGTPAKDQTLAQPFPPGVFGAFVRVSPDGTRALVAESSFGEIVQVDLVTFAARMDLATFGVRHIATISKPFDVIFLSDTEALVSASPTGDGTMLLYLNLATGAQHPVAQFSGPSGPLALDAAGNLYYVRGTDLPFPAPPGSYALLRFSRADVAEAVKGARVLDESVAERIATLDSGFDLAMNHSGDIFVTALLGPVSRVTISLSGASKVSPFAQTIDGQFAIFTYAAFYQPTRGFLPWYRKSPARLAFFLDDFSGHQQVIVVRPAPRSKR